MLLGDKSSIISLEFVLSTIVSALTLHSLLLTFLQMEEYDEFGAREKQYGGQKRDGNAKEANRCHYCVPESQHYYCHTHCTISTLKEERT